MKVKVKWDNKTKTVELGNGSAAEDAVIKMKISPEIVLVKRNDRIIPMIEKLKNNDCLEVLKVVSGG